MSDAMRELQIDRIRLLATMFVRSKRPDLGFQVTSESVLVDLLLEFTEVLGKQCQMIEQVYREHLNTCARNVIVVNPDGGL